MNTYELQRLLEHFVSEPYRFAGVFPRDKLPAFTRFSCYVANTDPAGQPGQHWVAFCVSNSCTEYFDSFALPVTVHGFKLDDVQPVLSSAVQSLTSDACGHHCVMFLVLRSRGYSLARIRCMYSRHNFTRNDAMAKRFVFKLAAHWHSPSLLMPTWCQSCVLMHSCCCICKK